MGDPVTTMNDAHAAVAHNTTIGTGSTLLAFTLDGSTLSKFALAVLTSVVASLISALIQRLVRGKKS